MKRIILVIFFFISMNILAQTKYMVYFKDKGIDQKNKLSKTSEYYKEAEKALSPKAIERRKKVLGEEYIDYSDIRINDVYLEKIEEKGIKIVHKLKWFNAVSAFLTSEELEELQLLPFVEKIEIIKTLKSESTSSYPIPFIPEGNEKASPNFTYFYGESLNQNILSDVPYVHDMGITGEGVFIGLLDTGFRWKSNPPLRGRNVFAEYDFVQKDLVTSNESGDVATQDSHGTSVFSLIGGFQNGEMIGPAFNAQFALAKTEFVPTETNIEEDNYAAAMEWLESLGVDLTSSSLGYSTFDKDQRSYSYAEMNGLTTLVARASEIAFNKGVVTLSSAGNERNNSWGYITSPADALNILAVGSVTGSGAISYFSSYGPTSDGRIKPEIVAQGSNTLNVTTAGNYTYGSGTSFSCPIAAGVTALLMSAHPYLKNYQVREIMMESASNSDSPNNDIGWGIVSALKAVTYPNLRESNGNIVLTKAFQNPDQMNVQTLKLHFKGSSGIEQMIAMNYQGGYIFTTTLPQFVADEVVNFYFTYESNGGIINREPSNNEKSFKMTGGKLNILTSAKNVEEVILPQDYVLIQNYPNPFNGSTLITFLSKDNSNAELEIFNVLGEKIKTLYSGIASVGKNNIYWNGTNDLGETIASGSYIYSLKINGTVLNKKLLYLK
ncbi:MAG: S8 family serine peptidase [Melioribacteraceae bacterium]|nr:S8 family serine peptidase [Melioribacteraceae bacterium]